MIYLFYRWFVALYYFAWLIAIGALTRHAERYLIYLSNWGYCVLVSYLLSAALSTSYVLAKNAIKKVDPDEIIPSALEDYPSVNCGCGCCNRNGISWYMSITWILFLLSSEMSIPICFVYWTQPDDNITNWGVTLHLHLFNVLPAFFDLFITGFPVRLLHNVYLMAFSVVYAVFAVIYFFAGGTDTDGNPYIYKILDFKNNTITAAAVVILFPLIVSNLVHMLFWGLYLFKVALLSCKLSSTSNPVNPTSLEIALEK